MVISLVRRLCISFVSCSTSQCLFRSVVTMVKGLNCFMPNCHTIQVKTFFLSCAESALDNESIHCFVHCHLIITCKVPGKVVCSMGMLKHSPRPLSCDMLSATKIVYQIDFSRSADSNKTS